MTSVVKKIAQRKAIWALVVVLTFLVARLPQTYQAQILGPVINEVEPNDDTPQLIETIPVVVHGVSGGHLVPKFSVFPVDIPPIIDPRTGNVVGTPRKTQIILFLNVFQDCKDLYQFQVPEPWRISINLAEAGTFHELSDDAQQKLFGAKFPPPIGPVVTPTDLDLFLFNGRTGAFIDGAFDGPGLIFIKGGGGVNPPFKFFSPETLPSDVAPGNPFFVPTRLERHVPYIVNVQDRNKITIFFLTLAPDQQILTNDLVLAWDSSTDDPYILRIGGFGLGGGVTEEVEPVDPKGHVKFEFHYTPTQSIRGAVDDYYVFDVLTPSIYTFNVSYVGSQRQEKDPGRLFLLRLDQATNRWEPAPQVGQNQSTIVERGLESLPNVRLESGRYMIAVRRDGIKPVAKKFNYAISVLDETGQIVAMEVNGVIPDVAAAAKLFLQSLK